MPGQMWPSNPKLTGLSQLTTNLCRASQCNEGFYTSQADGLVHGEGDCVRCPPGARRGRVPPITYGHTASMLTGTYGHI